MSLGNTNNGAVVTVHPTNYVREMIDATLNNSQLLYLQGSFSNLTTAVNSFSKSTPNVLILDTSANESHSSIHRLVSAYPSIAIVMSGVELDVEEITNYAKVGVSGYITIEDKLQDIATAAENAYQGKIANSKIASMLNRYLYIQNSKPNLNSKSITDKLGQSLTICEVRDSRLTSREEQVIRLIYEGLSNKEIASRLNLEVSTIKNHVHSILSKYKVQRRSLAAARYREFLESYI